MTFTLKHKELDSRGSFVAWGIGFEYEYDATSNILNINNARKKTPLINIEFDDALSKNALLYTAALEKATQINALSFSNNIYIDLSEILKERHLKTMLKTASVQARYSFDLKTEKFSRFEKSFCKDYFLSKLHFNKCINNAEQSVFYHVELETQNYNTVRCSSAHLYSVIHKLSNKTVRDLMISEYGSHSQTAARNLLAASSNLSIISKILNKNLNPMHRIKQISDEQAKAFA